MKQAYYPQERIDQGTKLLLRMQYALSILGFLLNSEKKPFIVKKQSILVL